MPIFFRMRGSKRPPHRGNFFLMCMRVYSGAGRVPCFFRWISEISGKGPNNTFLALEIMMKWGVNFSSKIKEVPKISWIELESSSRLVEGEAYWTWTFAHCNSIIRPKFVFFEILVFFWPPAITDHSIGDHILHRLFRLISLSQSRSNQYT